jgi:hypothetical protein
MPDQNTLTLQQVAAETNRWQREAGSHYCEIAAWLRQVAAKCRLPNPQRELLNLAKRYDRMSKYLTSRASLH